MFKLRLRPHRCISCGICMDVCPPRAIDMRLNLSTGIEGSRLTIHHLEEVGAIAVAEQRMMTFPFMSFPDRCDGCMLCVHECPVEALILHPLSEESARG